jgi:hypothetical protein
MPANPGDARLGRWEKLGLLVFAQLVVAFGVLVDIRSAFQLTPKTDFGVYARAAWAVREGQDLYTITDNNGWHYCYPPTFAILLAPLADPYPFGPHDGYLPFGVSVAIWYAFGVLCVGFAVHTLASIVLPGAARGSRRWWYARMIPVYVCLGGIGATLGRGQVNTLLVALIVAMFAVAVRGRRIASGLWLAGAVALKVIPGLLVLFPLARRDLRPLAGLAVGSVVLLGVIPAAVWGVPGAVEKNRKVVDLVLAPGATGGGDQTRAFELTNTTATHSQSFQAVIHTHLHPDPTTRPPSASRETRLAHWAIGGALTLATFAAGWRHRHLPPADQLVFLGCLCVLLVLLSPIAHRHYLALGLPLVAGLWLRSVAARPGAAFADRRTAVVLAGWGVVTVLVLLPGQPFEWLRDMGGATAATVALWAFGLWVIRRPAVPAPATEPLPAPPPARAA